MIPQKWEKPARFSGVAVLIHNSDFQRTDGVALRNAGIGMIGRQA